MKVIFTIDSLAQGGTEQSIAELIPHFTKNIEVVVVYFYNSHHLKQLYETINCRLYYLDIDEKYGFYDAMRKFNRLVNKEKPDVVVSSLYRSLIISRFVCWWSKTPLIGTFVNERYGVERKDRFKGLSVVKYYLTWFLDWVTAFIPQKIISNSYSISLLNGRALGIGSNKIKVIYRGRNTRNYQVWEIPSDKNLFVWIAVGRLIPQKGYDNLLLAFSKLHKKYPEARLRIIGEGPIRRELEMQINKLEMHDKVFLEGNIPLGWQKLYDAHAFVLPSISEGFSGALVEACITGIPIVASDIPMNLEAISPGKDAYFFRHNDWTDLYKKMVELMSNYTQACETGKIVRLRAIDNYDIEHIANQYEKTIETVVYGKRT
jgi:glycosyltransferase involved in cell wall biosynthesis